MITAHSSVDWGNVPAWVGAILTGGSLLLGFYIILQGRREQRRSQADKVMYWHDATDAWPVTMHLPPLRITVRNGSAQPIVNVRLAAGSYSRSELYKLDRLMALRSHHSRAELQSVNDSLTQDGSPAYHRILMPDDQVEFTVAGRWAIFQDYFAYNLFFTDGSGRSWRRNVISGKIAEEDVTTAWKLPKLFSLYTMVVFPFVAGYMKYRAHGDDRPKDK